MKETCLLFAFGILCLAIGGCEKSIERAEKTTIGLSAPDMPDPYNKIVYDAALAKALSYNTTMILSSAEGKIFKQKEQIRSMQYLHFNVIAISPYDLDSIQPNIQECKSAGIHIVLINTYWYEGVDAAVFLDYKDAAKKSSDYLAQLKQNGAIYSLFYTDGLSKSNLTKLTTEITSNLDPTKYTANLNNGSARYCASQSAAKTTARTLINRPSPSNVTAFIAYDDVTAKGIRDAIVELNKQNEIILINISGSPDAKLMVKNNEMNGTVSISPSLLGEEIINVAHALSLKQPVNKETKIPATLIHSQNINQFNVDSWK